MQTNSDQVFQARAVIDDIYFLKNLVNINSQSKNSKGVNTVQSIIFDRLERLGFDSIFVENPEFDSGYLLHGKKNMGYGRTISFICHADTVVPASDDCQFSQSEDGQFLYGPGIADNKSGILVALKGIEYYLEHAKNPKLNFDFICSPNEELGSPGFHQYFKRIGEQSEIHLGFEPSLPNGDIISSRSGNRWYKIISKGETYHAGRAKKGHMNAGIDLCRILTYIANEFEKHEEITMNIGMMEGGHSYNTICADIYAKIDTRFSCFQGLEKIKKIMENCFSHLKKECSVHEKISTTEFQIKDFCPPLESNRNQLREVEKYLNLTNSILGTNYKASHSGGAADINHFSFDGSIGIDGLGAIGDHMHRKDEFILTESLVTKSIALGEYLLMLDREEIC